MVDLDNAERATRNKNSCLIAKVEYDECICIEKVVNLVVMHFFQLTSNCNGKTSSD